MQITVAFSWVINWFLNFVGSNFIVSMLLLTVTGIYYDIRYHICHLCLILHTIDITTASVITTFFVHSRLDYCNSLYHELLNTKLKRLQQIENARIVTLTHKHSRMTPTLNHFIGNAYNNSKYSSLLTITLEPPTYVNQLLSTEILKLGHLITFVSSFHNSPTWL